MEWIIIERRNENTSNFLPFFWFSVNYQVIKNYKHIRQKRRVDCELLCECELWSVKVNHCDVWSHVKLCDFSAPTTRLMSSCFLLASSICCKSLDRGRKHDFVIRGSHGGGRKIPCWVMLRAEIAWLLDTWLEWDLVRVRSLDHWWSDESHCCWRAEKTKNTDANKKRRNKVRSQMASLLVFVSCCQNASWSQPEI